MLIDLYYLINEKENWNVINTKILKLFIILMKSIWFKKKTKYKIYEFI